ncbi:MAG: Ribosomal RNA small subunit methyltransferase G [Clostridiales bacterium 38_11]|nr:MAG: Ribosomal RNA small subunit methyltransferase G [Clostridiales bacterium 38_11]HBH12806.1 16S rRNA (guanine(527)-N(7))-methyltransferase RsmG [Clostridiales bacterium]
MNNQVETLFRQSDIAITTQQINQFLDYEKLILKWNQNINITAITRSRDIYIKHFIDSAVINQYIGNNQPYSMIDVGTGGGFPGIPMKIMDETIQLTLLDSLKKRIAFLQAVVENLELKEVKLMHGRAEDFGSNVDFREKYDVATSRAVASINILAEYCLPFVKIGGVFIALKGENIEDELKNGEKAVKLLGGEVSSVIQYVIPGTDIGRSVVIIKKMDNTPEKYPRKAGTPSRKPL